MCEEPLWHIVYEKKYYMIGFGDSVLWPPWSPDLTPLDIYGIYEHFLWDHLKNWFVKTQLLQKWTVYFCGLAAATCAVSHCTHACIDMRGGHFEQFLTLTYADIGVHVFNKDFFFLVADMTSYFSLVFFSQTMSRRGIVIWAFFM